MISPKLVMLGNELLRAAGRRRYADVERLSVQVGTATAGEARTLPAGDPGVSELAAWLKDLFDRTEIQLRVGRAAHAAELRRIAFLRKYLARPDRRAAHVRLAL
jgi:hypothetical protein